MIIDNLARARHISELCAAFNIKLIVKIGMPPEYAATGYMPLTGKAAIMIAPVKDETTYAVALHELGHRLHPIGCLKFEMSEQMQMTNRYSSVRDIRLTLESERAAWEWAMDNCLGRDWTPVMDIVRVMALRSYERDAKKILGHVP